jgi:hypothetical protein
MTAAKSATVTVSSAAPLGFGARLVHIQRPSPQLAAVECGDSFVAFFRVHHFDETESARTAGIAISQDRNAVHLSVCLEHLSQLIFRGVEIEIAHEDILHALCPCLSYLSVADFGEVAADSQLDLTSGAGGQSNAEASIAGFAF